MHAANLIVAAALALGLAACASTTPIETAKQPATISGFATLASSGSFDFETSPALTRIAQIAHNAARQTEDGRISVAVAKTIRARLGYARTMIADALASHKADPVRARELLAKATDEINFSELLLKGRS